MLRLVLNYDPDTGEFRWRQRDNDKSFNSRHAGIAPGTMTASHGYRSIGVTLSKGHKHYLAHRLAWLYHYGEWPKYVIDHLDRNPQNNSVTNLKDVTTAENNKNKRQNTGESKMKGVQRARNKWTSTGYLNGVTYRFGNFSTIEEASEASKDGMNRILIDSDFEIKNRKYKQPKTQHDPDKKITHEELLSYYHYDKQNGKFYRRLKTGLANAATHGSKATAHKDNYSRISIKGRRYLSHVLAWFYMTGMWPNGVIDHIDGDKNNQQFSNLRDVTYCQNALNRKPDQNRGIRQTRNKVKRWEARIKHEKIEHHLGTFDTREQAVAAWQTFVDHHCAEFVR